jgi:hypothetical protein
MYYIEYQQSINEMSWWYNFFRLFSCFDGNESVYWHSSANQFEIKRYKYVARKVPVEFTELVQHNNDNAQDINKY